MNRAKLAVGWSLWEWARLRGAGFSVENVAALAAPRAALAATALLEAEAAAIEQRDAVTAVILEAMRASHGPQRTSLSRALKRIRSGRPTDAIDAAGDQALVGSIMPLVALEARLAAAQQELDHALAEAEAATQRSLQAAIAQPAFHEAVVWQNRSAWTNGCASFARHLGPSTSKSRKQERLVANYLQRYATKNDTIGFFGPNGWARVDPTVDDTSATPGPSLLKSRTVYFEYWAIDALATSIVDDDLKPHLAPRRSPNVWVEGTTLHHPIDRTSELPAEFAAVLAACDGERSADELAARFGDDTLELLAELEERELVTWTIEIPTATARPETYLRAILDRAGASGARGIAMLDELERARTTVAEAAGDPDRLERAFAGLEETFQRLTRTEATRNSGQMYAARTLLYEDCRRDFELVLGSRFLSRTGPALALVLDSARWYTYEIAQRYLVALRKIFDELAVSGVVDYLRFWQQARALFPGKAGGGIVDAVRAELVARWDKLFAFDPARRIAEYTVEEMRGRFDFSAPHPGWPSARHHSPDILLTDTEIVLGEIHVGMNTCAVQVALEQHHDPQQLIAAREADLPSPGIAPVWSKAKTRADFYSQSSRDYDLETGATRSTRPRDHVLAVGTLVVEDRDGKLIVRPRSGGLELALIAFLEQHLIAESFSQFDLLPARPHTPRVVVDGVVFAREKWRFDCAQLPFLVERTPARRFVEVRRWARAAGMPRYVFVKTDTEVKPKFVDFDSPILIDILCADLSHARDAAVTEMLPSVGQCWLADKTGARYTSELRMVATDPAAWEG